MELPKFTILYNKSNDNSKWIGTGWEFFDDKKKAEERFEQLNREVAYCPTLRPYHHKTDFEHLGAVHRQKCRLIKGGEQ